MSPQAAASLIVLLEVLSFGAIFPVMSDYCEQLGSTPESATLFAGIMFALVAGPRIIMNTLWGRLSDRIGRKRVLTIITTGTLAGSVLWALSMPLHSSLGYGLLWLGASRLTAGFFQAQAALTQAVIADSSTPENRAKGMGMLGASFGLGMLGGILLGGIVGTHFSIAAVGWASAIAQLLSIAVIIFCLPETHPIHKSQPSNAPTASPDQFNRLPIRRLLSQKMLTNTLLVIAVMTLGHMVLVPILPKTCKDWFNFDRTDITTVFAVWMFVGVFVQGGMIRPMVQRCGETGTIKIGLFILTTGLALMGAASQSTTIFWTAAILIAIGGSFATPALTATVSHAVTPSDQGAAQGLNQSVTAIGRTCSYLIAGALYVLSPSIPYFVGATIVLISLIFALALKPAQTNEAT